MPLVFIHGVASRSPEPDPVITALMQRYLSDVISPGRDLTIEYAFWGDVAASFAWGGASRPRTPLLGMGGITDVGEVNRAVLAAGLSDALKNLPLGAASAATGGGGLVSGRSHRSETAAKIRLADLAPKQLSDLLAAIINEQAGAPRRADLLIVADEVAHDPGILARLALESDLEAEWALLAREIKQRAPGGPLVGMGPGGLSRVGDRLRESLSRGAGLPGFVASRVVAEFREPVNDLAARFVGDVLAYVLRRGDVDDVGPIPRRFIDALRRARSSGAPDDEPTVVVSHSMGGQVVYDVVTSFLPEIAANRDLRVDFWCATASQVGLFEELNMFLARSAGCAPAKVPFPSRAHLGVWWNVWDHNDFLSYTAAPIFDGVDDEGFDTGMTLVGAHSGYLMRPSFYRRFSDKLETAKVAQWHR